MLNWIGGLLDRVFAVIGALIFVQAPLFMQQYTQQLIGRETELRWQVDAIRHSANLSGKTLEQLAQKFIANSDSDIARQGELIFTLVDRWHHCSESLAAMQESSIWSRPLVFLYHFNSETFFSTLHHYKIGLPLTIEGAIYALLGIVAGYLIFAFFRILWRKTCLAKRSS